MKEILRYNVYYHLDGTDEEYAGTVATRDEAERLVGGPRVPKSDWVRGTPDRVGEDLERASVLDGDANYYAAPVFGVPLSEIQSAYAEGCDDDPCPESLGLAGDAMLAVEQLDARRALTLAAQAHECELRECGGVSAWKRFHQLVREWSGGNLNG